VWFVCVVLCVDMSRSTVSFVALALAAVVGLSESGSSEVSIAPNDSRIHYIGRFMDDTDNTKTFAWTASQIAVKFDGASSIEASLYGSKSADRFLVIVDGELVNEFTTEATTWDTYSLTSGLSADSNHTLVLWKATEDNTQKNRKGAASFGGFSVPKGGNFYGDVPRQSRKIHFIGDSDTAGWCADGSSNTGDSANKYENSYETWAAQLSRELDAEMAVTAISGIGVLSWPIQQYLDYTLTFDTHDGEKWDYTQWTPDAVVMLIGPNDPSQVRETKFISSYVELMEQVATNYGYAATAPKIISVCGGSINGLDPCDNIAKAIDSFNSERTDGFVGSYVSITTDDWSTINAKHSEYLGCDDHYSPSGHAVLESDIVGGVKEIMGW